MKKWDFKKWLSCLLATLMIFMNVPQMIHAQDDSIYAVDSESALVEALNDLNEGETIQLTASFDLTAHITINKDVTVDLNGQTITMGNYSFKIQGTQENPITVTIKDSGDNGKLTGTNYIIDMNGGGADTVKFESGTLEGTGYRNAVARIQNGDYFIMSGGTARQTHSNATWVLYVMGSGKAEVIEGRIEGSYGIKASASASTVIVGAKPAGSKQTTEEASKVYVSSINSSKEDAAILLYSGTFGKITGSVGSGFVLDGWFEQDVSGVLPAGMMCAEVDGHWEVSQLTQENAVAMIGDTYYGSLVKAAAELKDGEVLVLLKDYNGTQNVKVTVNHAIIDLNGHNITNSTTDGYGLEITSNSGDAQGELGVTVRNSSSTISRISANIPLYARSGNSLKAMPVLLAENIELVSNSENTLIELGTSAYIEYNEKVASYITVGGFLSNHSDGKQYIHGSFTQAAENDINHTAVLLNDYQGGISLSAENISLTLDLNGHTVTSDGTSVIRVNTSDAELTIKNGVMINNDGTGAEVGIPAGGAPGGNVTYFNNVTLNLENVDLTANSTSNEDYGIVCNGVSTGININLKGGSVIANDMIGIYFPAADSTLTIDGTKVTGTTAVAIKGGTVNITNNAEIIGTGERRNPTAGINSGVNDTGAAIYVEGNYDRDIQVNVDNGTFTSEKGLAVQMLEDSSATGEKNIVLKGGTYSNNPNPDFIYPGLGVVENNDETFTIARKASVYVNGLNGNDTNSGEDRDHAVKTLEHALNLVDESGTIYICGGVTIDSSLILDGVNIERESNYKGTLLTVSGSDTVLTISNTTIDGKKIEGTSFLVNVTNGATVNIQEGAKLVNNNKSAVFVGNRSYLNMSGGEISGNHDDVWGAGIFNSSGMVNLTSGEIKNNTAGQGAGIVTLNGTTILDGATICNNAAETYGGGVYVYGDSNNLAVFEMKSGSITDNTASKTGAGIFTYAYDGDVTAKISGGTIKDNVSTEENMGHAITIFGYEGSILYPRLELSGQPQIDGDIFYQNDYEDGYVIYVTDEFNPVNPIEISRSNSLYDIPAVNYADGLTPNRDNFISGSLFDGFVVDGQNLNWAEASIVYFYDEDEKTEYREYRHGVVLGETIDGDDVPTPSKTGYTLSGWKERGTDDVWDMENDQVSKSTTRLVAIWSLNVPTVSIETTSTNVHEGQTSVLEAKATHELDNLTYTYQWYEDGVALEGETKSTLTVSESGNYMVKVKASDGQKTSAEVESAVLEFTVEDHVYVPNVTAPTCTEKGYTTYTCDICGDTYVANYTDPTGHSYSVSWVSDDTSHWHECSECNDKKDVAEHIYTWVIDKEATATEAGLKHEECTVCGHEKASVEIPATGDPDKPTEDTETPNTNDDSYIFLWIGLLFVTGAVLLSTYIYKRKTAKR